MSINRVSINKVGSVPPQTVNNVDNAVEAAVNGKREKLRNASSKQATEPKKSAEATLNWDSTDR